MIDFSIPPELESHRQSVTAFMNQYVYPNEHAMVEDEGLPAELESELQRKVKTQGLWAPNLPREWGGISRRIAGMISNAEFVQPPKIWDLPMSKPVLTGCIPLRSHNSKLPYLPITSPLVKRISFVNNVDSRH